MAFIIKRNDTRPILTAQLTSTDPFDVATQIPVDLTAATTVKFFMRLAPNIGTLEVSGTATVTDAVNGKVSYTFTAADTDTSGVYLGEFEVAWGADRQTFPSDSYIAIEVKDDLGPQALTPLADVLQFYLSFGGQLPKIGKDWLKNPQLRRG